jgi:hypothetical protein
MITRRMSFLPCLCLSLAMGVTACSGSGIDGIGYQDDITEASSADTTDRDGSVSTPDDSATSAPSAYPALDCLVETCEGQTCRNSSTCVVGLVCMAACTDSTCAEACLTEAEEADLATLQVILTCANEVGCFGETPDAPACGDLDCAEGEDIQSCPEDCQGRGTGCLEDQCELGNCLDLPACADVVVCMGDCLNAECAQQCIELAPTEATTMLQAIVDCGEEAECFGPIGPGTTAPTCGDGECDASEACGSCTEDCGACPEADSCCAAHDATGCSDVECAASVCGENPSCCADSWGEVCAELALEVCDICSDEPVDTCGDGVCQGSESDTDCPEDCMGGEPTSCIEDNCSLGQCLDFDDCAKTVDCMNDCDDVACAEGCLEDTAGAMLQLLDAALACGTESGCFEGGTQTPPTDDCLTSSCDSGNCGDFPECAEALNCMDACSTKACAEACIEASPSIFQPPLASLLDCGVLSGCFSDGGSVCGDGWCVPPESADSCPEDCAGGPACGDDICSGGEGCNTCPDDCGECDGPCCSPHDAQGCGNSDCQVSVCDIDQGCCYDNWSWECAQLAAGVCAACSEGVVCGDGECAPSENSTNCPEDCSSPANDFLSCIYEVCEDNMDACFDDDACTDAFPCLEDCVNNGGTGCTGTCMPDPESEIFYQLGLCAGEKGCGNICGDGFCGPGETTQSCAADCPDIPTPDDCSSIGPTNDNGEFILCTEEESWAGAKERCGDLGGNLASIRSAAENETIEISLANAAWIGFNDFEDEGTFEWSDGASSGYTNWNGGEPNDYGDGEDCTEIIAAVGSGVWNDSSCTNQKDFVCRVGGDDPGTDPGDGPDPPGPGDGDSCATDNCEIGWQCGWGGCEEAIACVAGCDSAECAAGCVESATFWQTDAIQALADCADAAGCF